MSNLQMVEGYPRWAVWFVAQVARLVGIVIHVEGIPFGAPRLRKPSRAVDTRSTVTE